MRSLDYRSCKVPFGDTYDISPNNGYETDKKKESQMDDRVVIDNRG